MNLAYKKQIVLRLRAWPRAERQFVTRLTEREAEWIGEAAVELDLTPCAPPEPGPGLIEIANVRRTRPVA